jgi:outer membrane receptor protein involved in Fe transport
MIGKKILTLIAVSSFCVNALAQKTMTGKITDKNNEPLTGTIIAIENTRIATLSNTLGHYTLHIPKEYENENVVFEYIGYITQSIPAKDGQMDIIMETVVPKTVEDLLVSTQKRLQTSIDVPIAITAFDQNRLDELNTTKIDEISNYIAGFNNIIQGQNKAGYSIRGVTSDGMESFFQPRISVFLNGVSISREQVSALETYDIERIEVARGPQGTLFGRGAEIGAVHFITKRPEKDFSAQLKLNYGGYNQRGAYGYLNTPISEKIANRFAFGYDYHDGYIKNLAGGRLNGQNTIALRNTFSIFNAEKSSFNIILDYQHDMTPGVSFKSKKIAPEGGDTSPFTTAHLNGGEDLGVERHIGGLTLEYERKINDNLNISNTFGVRYGYANEFFDGDGTYYNILDANEKASNIQFSEEFRLNWTKSDRLSGFVGVGAMYEYCEHSLKLNSDLTLMYPFCVTPQLKPQIETIPQKVAEGVKSGIENFKAQLLSQYPPEYAEQITQALDGFNAAAYPQILNAMNENLNTWNEWLESPRWEETPDFFGTTKNTVSGILINTLNALLQQMPQAAALLNGASAEQVVAGMNLENGLSDLQKISNAEIYNEYEENHTNYSHNYETDIFSDLTWEIFDNFFLTVGLRGTYEKQETGYYSTSMTAPIVGTMIYQNSNGKTYWIDGTNFSWVGRFVLNYMINKYNNVYASVSKGHRPGVVYFNYSPEKPTELRPEVVRNYELGLKGYIINNKLAYATALYYYKWLHFQSSTAYTAEDGSRKYHSDDKGLANCYGTELSLKYFCKRFVTIFGDYTYFGGKFADKDEDGQKQEYAGHKFRLSPETAFDLGADVVIPIKGKYELYFRPNISYKSKLYFEDKNDISQDECSIVNATLGIRFAKKRLNYDFGLWGKNITNTEYLIDAGNAGEIIGFPTYVAGAPQNFGVKLSVSFR